MILSLCSLVLFFQTPKNTEFIFFSSMGVQVTFQRLAEDQKAHALDNLEGINRFIIDSYTDIQIQGSKLFVDAEILESEGLLLVVSPKNYSRAVLVLDLLDFIRLIITSTTWGVDDAAIDYFYLYPPHPEPLKQNTDPNRFIDPHACNNTHPQDEPHRTEPGNSNSPCHGEVGESGMCMTQTSNIEYHISCSTWQTGNGQSTVEKCTGHIECLHGGGFLNGTMTQTRFVNCRSLSGVSTMTVGIDELGRAFVKCGPDTMTLDCPK